MEEKMRKQKKGKGNSSNEDEDDEEKEKEDGEEEEAEVENDPEEESEINHDYLKPSSENEEDVVIETTPKYSLVPIQLKPVIHHQTVSSTTPSVVSPHNHFAAPPTRPPLPNRPPTSTRPPPPAPPILKTIVESEKVEVIEIKSDGSSGHLFPGRN